MDEVSNDVLIYKLEPLKKTDKPAKEKKGKRFINLDGNSAGTTILGYVDAKSSQQYNGTTVQKALKKNNLKKEK